MRISKAGTLALLIAASAAAGTGVADTPPMGWNSWDAYGTTVTEAEVKANADAMAAQLKSYGWQYIVVDIQWSDPNARAHGYRPNAELAMDAYGRLIPAENRFPSSAGGRGFRALADYVHSRGLKFGIHIMRGIPRRAVAANLPVFGSSVHAGAIADRTSTCKWNSDMYGVNVARPGGQEYYDSLVAMYASWGVDYIKADDIARPLHAAEIEALHRAIIKSGRPIVLSLSPGPADLAHADFYAANANLWRVSDDFWDLWKDLRAAFGYLAQWSSYVRPGAWPDGDMLPLGRIGLRAERGDDRFTRFTHDEQRTLMTLWSIARSPLMFGGDLPSLDPWTLSLLSNDEVLAADQKAVRSRQLFARGDDIAWTSDLGSSAKFVALFNAGDEGVHDLRVEWKDLGLSGTVTVRDLWERKTLGKFEDGFSVKLAPHAAAMLLVQQ
jgi:alpha-galactosidase